MRAFNAPLFLLGDRGANFKICLDLSSSGKVHEINV